MVQMKETFTQVMHIVSDMPLEQEISHFRGLPNKTISDNHIIIS